MMSHHLCSSHDTWFVCMHTSKIILLSKWYEDYLCIFDSNYVQIAETFSLWRQSSTGIVSLEVSEISIPRGSPAWKKPRAIFANLKGDATLSTRGTRSLLRFSPNLNSLPSAFFSTAAVLCPGPVSYHDLNDQSSSGYSRQNEFYLLILKYLIKRAYLPAQVCCQLGQHPGVPL